MSPLLFLAQEVAVGTESAASKPFWAQWIDPQVLGNMGVAFLKSLILAILVFMIGKWVAQGLTNLFRRLLRRSKVEETLVGFFANIAHALLLVFVVLAALEQLGVNTTSASAIIAAAGLAVGFALQGSLSNFAAGVMMVFFRPVKVGDLVQAGGTFGVVEEIALFATVFRTPDGKKVIVPNSGITGGNIENFSVNGTIRVDMKFGIGYGDDIDRAKEVLKGILSADERVLKEPAPVVAVVGHGESSIDFVCRPWVDPKDYWNVWFDTHERAKKAFDAAGVSIPFPQRDVHVHQVPLRAS